MNPRNVWGRDIAAPLNTLQSELHRLYEHYKQAGGPGPAAGPADPAPAPSWTPALDLYETAEEIGILIDLPGIDPATVELAVTGRTLTLRGLKPRDELAHHRGQTLERPHGHFARTIELPGDVDVDAVQAEARHGVIAIRLPKVAAARARTIPIHGGD